MPLDELTPLDWAVQTLLADAAIIAFVGQRIDEDDDVPVMLPTETPEEYYPRIVYSGIPHGVPYAEALLLGWGEYTVKVVMREDALPEGEDLKEYTGRIAQMVEEALSGVRDPGAGGHGTMHGCRIAGFHTPPLYGPPGRRICERGRRVHVTWSQ